MPGTFSSLIGIVDLELSVAVDAPKSVPVIECEFIHLLVADLHPVFVIEETRVDIIEVSDSPNSAILRYNEAGEPDSDGDSVSRDESVSGDDILFPVDSPDASLCVSGAEFEFFGFDFDPFLGLWVEVVWFFHEGESDEGVGGVGEGGVVEHIFIITICLEKDLLMTFFYGRIVWNVWKCNDFCVVCFELMVEISLFVAS